MSMKTLFAAALVSAAVMPAAVATFRSTQAAGQSSAQPSAQAPADVVFRNGDVYTMDPQRPWARGVAVRGGRSPASPPPTRLRPASSARTRASSTWAAGSCCPASSTATSTSTRPARLDHRRQPDDGGGRRRPASGSGPRRQGGRVRASGSRAACGGPTSSGRWRREGRRHPGAGAGSPIGRTIDPLTPDNPCLLSSFDSKLFLANTAALRAAGLETERVEGLHGRRRAGRATGLLPAGRPRIGGCGRP